MPATNLEIHPMRFHGPGWTLDLTTYDEYGDETEPGPIYQLWAPQDCVIPDPHGYANYQESGWEGRLTWAASWQSADRADGGFKHGDSAADVLAIFDADTRDKFVAVLNRIKK